MSSYSLNTILKSYVSEQACLPFMSPVSACVCSNGSKGSLKSLFKQFSYNVSNGGFFARSFPAFLRNAGEKSNSRFIPYCLHSLFRGPKANWSFFFRFQNPINKRLALFLFFKNVPDKVPDFNQSRVGKFWKHFFYMLYFVNCGVHSHIIAQFLFLQTIISISQRFKTAAFGGIC